MGCTSPKIGFPNGLTDNGKLRLTFREPEDFEGEVQPVACGKCDSCRMDYAKQWATRLCHEMQSCKLGMFITLTFSPECYPEDCSVHLEDMQKFMKRFRKSIEPVRVKFFACGEYGGQKFRPHYHVIILGWTFPDKRVWKMSKSGYALYRSPSLEKLWEFGWSSIGEVDFRSAAYVARYTLKKTGRIRDYEVPHPETGELFKIEEEFVTMSGGIGSRWWERFKSDTDKDYLLAGDSLFRVKVPRYYDRLREKVDPGGLAIIKAERGRKAKELQEKDPSGSLNKGKAIVREKQKSMLIRSYEDEKTDVRDFR